MKKEQNKEYRVKSLDVYKQNQEKKERKANNPQNSRISQTARPNTEQEHTESIRQSVKPKRSKNNRKKTDIRKSEKNRETPFIKKSKTKKNKKKSKASRKLLILNTALISSAAGIFFLLIMLMNRYSVISELKYDINAQERALNELRNKKREIQVQIEHSNRTDFIERTAREQLFMEYPTEEETIYIRVD